MPLYVDGFVIPVPKKNVEAYRKMAKAASKLWIEHGALEYREAIGHDLKQSFALTFPKGIRAKPSEAIFFSWVVYKSRAARDRVNKKIMKDPRVAALCDPKNMPFDAKRMLYGGFEVVVSA